jgi:hypothetical protein
MFTKKTGIYKPLVILLHGRYKKHSNVLRKFVFFASFAFKNIIAGLPPRSPVHYSVFIHRHINFNDPDAGRNLG